MSYWNLIKEFTIAEIKIKYKGSILGFMWSFLEPLFLIFLIFMIFSQFFGADVEHYSIFALIGVIFWGFFSTGTTKGLGSIVNKANLVRNIAFPKEVLVISSIIATSIDFLIKLIIALILAELFYSIPITPIFLFLILVILLQSIIIITVSLIISSIHVHYRDMASVWAVLLRIGFFATPIIYPAESLPATLKILIYLNPISYILQFSRELIIKQNILWFFDYIVLFIISTSCLILCFFIFKKIEKKFAEVV